MRALVLLGLLLITLSNGCIIDPQKTRPGRGKEPVMMPPLALDWELSVEAQAEAVYLFNDMLYLCVPEKEKGFKGEKQYTLKVIDLKKKIQKWQIHRTLCIFKQAEQVVYILYSRPKQLVIQRLHVETGEWLGNFQFDGKICPKSPPVGPGVALLHQDPYHPCRTRFAVNGGYLLFWDQQKIQVFDRYLGKSFWNFPSQEPSENSVQIFQTTIHNGILYTLLKTNKKPVRSIPLTTAPSLIPEQGIRNVQLRAYDLRQKKLLWVDSHLPLGIVQAQIHHNHNQLILQIAVQSPVPASLEKFIHLQEKKDMDGKDIWIYNFSINAQIGQPQWQNPWILQLGTSSASANTSLPSILFQNEMYYTRLGHRIYAFGQANEPVWSRYIKESTTGKIRPFDEKQILFENDLETFIFDKKQGTETFHWHPKLLYTQSSEFSKTSPKWLQNRYVVHALCHLEYGGTSSTLQDDVWNAEHCSKIDLELHEIHIRTSSQTRRFPIPVPNGSQGLTFLHGKQLVLFHQSMNKHSIQAFWLP